MVAGSVHPATRPRGRLEVVTASVHPATRVLSGVARGREYPPSAPPCRRFAVPRAASGRARSCAVDRAASGRSRSCAVVRSASGQRRRCGRQGRRKGERLREEGVEEDEDEVVGRGTGGLMEKSSTSTAPLPKYVKMVLLTPSSYSGLAVLVSILIGTAALAARPSLPPRRWLHGDTSSKLSPGPAASAARSWRPPRRWLHGGRARRSAGRTLALSTPRSGRSSGTAASESVG